MAEIRDEELETRGHQGQANEPVRKTPSASNGEEAGTVSTEVVINDEVNLGNLTPDEQGRIVLNEWDCYGYLGFCFSPWKKWRILSIIFMVQISMNFNASVYGNAIPGLMDAYGITAKTALWGQGLFLIAYAFGCELWAPFSEQFGRRWMMQASLFLVNIWQIPCATSSNFLTIIICRILGGLSSAGGSVTLGIVADLFETDQQQYAVLFIVLASVGGSVVGPVVGGFLEGHVSWEWVFWIQLIFGVVVQVMHFFMVPETRATTLLDKKAKEMRKENPEKSSNYYGPGDVDEEDALSFKGLLRLWWRPFSFFGSEPIVLCLSLLSGFSDALIFTFLQSYTPVFQQWGFSPEQVGLAFVPIGIGYLLAYFFFIPDIVSQNRLRHIKGSANVSPERRLFGLLFVAPLLVIGLFGFASVSSGPNVLKGTNTWIVPMIFSSLIGIANFAVYYATVDYMVASYGPFSASATGGNGFARDLLAGLAAFYAMPLYTDINKPHNLMYGSIVLGCISFFAIIPIYIFYWKGQWFRERSSFAQSLKREAR